MKFIWISSNSPAAAELSFSSVDITRMESRDLLTSLQAKGETLIIEIGEPSDNDRALGFIEDASVPRPVWIFDPAATAASTVRWIKAGAVHVATSLDEIRALIDFERAAQKDATGRRSSLIGRSAAICKVDADIALVANRRCNLLIEGETGTGKEVVARETHAQGGRSRGPWVAVNCSAIPEALLEAELFGHVKGAFTGAVQARTGKFEAANHGSIFLDEIGDMPLAVQGKLLRVLQEHEVERLGGNERIRLDVRVIAATNVNLAGRVAAGLFRQDLYYRLNVFRIALPPLRDRIEDVPLLAQHLIRKVCSSERVPEKTIDRSAIERLMTYEWPGNVRELENTIEAAVIISGSRSSIFPSDLRLGRVTLRQAAPGGPERSVLPDEGIDYQKALEEFELTLLTQALSRARGNKTAAADLLRLKRTTLAAKMKVLESRLPRLVA